MLFFLGPKPKGSFLLKIYSLKRSVGKFFLFSYFFKVKITLFPTRVCSENSYELSNWGEIRRIRLIAASPEPSMDYL